MRHGFHIAIFTSLVVVQPACQPEPVPAEETNASELVLNAAGTPPAVFMFDDPPGTATYCVQLTDPKQIEHARGLIAGTVKDAPHIQGKIIKSRAPYNQQWHSQIDPATASFFSNAMEVCDATIPYLEDHLSEACGAFLPGCAWCPWASRLLQEVPTSCPALWNPVCGSNGRTYSSACTALAACVPVACNGMCPCLPKK